jgi:hypothetical protein
MEKRIATVEFAERDLDKIDISKFDESNLKEHQVKAMVAMGIYASLRGNTKHTNMKIDQITTKLSPPDHPLYPNYKCIQLRC